MIKLLFVVLLIFAPAVIAALFDSCIKNDCNADHGIEYVMKMTIFYGLYLTGISACIKVMTGKGSIAYLSTLENLSPRSFLHYIIIDALTLAILLIASKLRISKDYIYKLKHIFVNFASIIAIGSLLVVGPFVDCNILLFEILLSTVAAIIGTQLSKDRNSNNKQDCFNIKKIQHVIAAMLMWATVMFLYIPGELFLTNIEEMGLKMTNFFLSNVLWGVGIAIIGVMLLLYGVTDKLRIYVVSAVWGATIAGYTQKMFLNGQMSEFNGTVQTWGIIQIVLNAIIWVVIVITVVYVCVKMKTGLRIMSILSTCISLMLISTIVFVGMSTKQEDAGILTKNGELSLGTDRNVLVFVLDWFDTQYVDKIIEDEPDFFETLYDFTQYDNMSSLYTATEWAVPYLLTEVEWKPGLEIPYKEYAFENGSILEELIANGYSVGVYTDSMYFDKKESGNVINFEDSSDQSFSMENVAQLSYRTSRYLSNPFIDKARFLFTSDEYHYLVNDDNRWRADCDAYFYDDIRNYGVNIDRDLQKAFRFYHMYGAHMPYYTDENLTILPEDEWHSDDPVAALKEAKGSMKCVFEYINQLRNTEVYDNTTIIITADHGQNEIFASGDVEKLSLEPYSSPVLFVKTKDMVDYAKNSNPVTQKNLVETIKKECEITYDGICLEDAIGQACDNRKLYCIRRFNNWDEYTIIGDVKDWRNWSRQEMKAK